MKVNADHIKALEFMDKEDLLTMVKSMMGSGIALNFYGKRTAQEIDKKVRPHLPSSYLVLDRESQKSKNGRKDSLNFKRK